jgi:tRNA dimethylallyltransferase
MFLVRNRSELYARIEKRVDQMIEAGLEEEVRTLMERGYHHGLSSMLGLGYQHFLNCFQGKTSREEAVSLLKRDTKRFAKRQFTWFRREPEAVWVDVTGLIEAHEILERIKKNIEISNKVV